MEDGRLRELVDRIANENAKKAQQPTSNTEFT